MGSRPLSFLLCLSLAAAWAGVGPAQITPGVITHAQEAGLKPGDVAPDFTLPGSDGRTYSLADFKGKKPVVIGWFPRMMTKL